MGYFDYIPENWLIIVAQLYFRLVNFVFDIFNGLFIERKHVTRPRDPILLQPAVQLAKKIIDGELTSTEVVQAYIKRVEEVNPLLNVVIEKNYEEALAAAKAVDEQLSLLPVGSPARAELAKKKPFLGVPHTLKESFAVKGLLHTVGSLELKGFRAEEDSVVTQRFREAGAILLTTTNVPELCMWTESSNPLYGRTLNPYDTRRNVGGSSGGEGCILGAGAAVIGCGSDIGGSIRTPALLNGVYGHKGSWEVVPLAGHNPAPNLKSYPGKMCIAGPLVRYAADLEPTFRALGGEKAEKILSKPRVPLEKLKIIFAEGINSWSDEAASFDMVLALRKSVLHFERKFGIKAQEVKFPELHEARAMWFEGMLEKGQPHTSEWLGGKSGKINAFAELLKAPFGQSKYYAGTVLLAWLEELHDNYFTDEKRAEREKLKKDILDLIGDEGVMFWPTVATNADYHNLPLFKPILFMYNGLFSVLRLPSLACPIGTDKNGMPLGVALIAAPENDGLLFDVAQELEAAFGGWPLPPEN